jgi:nicotinate phosphoribosyltransferase
MPDKPIVTSMLQTDFYKFPMDLFEQTYFPGANVTYALKNRTADIRLAEVIDIGELKEHLDETMKLRHTVGGLQWLAGTYQYDQLMFPISYIQSLQSFCLPQYFLEKDGNGQYRLEFTSFGSTHWEIPALMIINTLLNRARMKSMTRSEIDSIYASGKLKLATKIREVKNYRELALKRGYQPLFFSDFGTRRCFSPEWHDYCVEMLKEELPAELRGTSNCFLAKKHEIMPMGTNAHQSQMIATGLAEEQGKDIRQAIFNYCLNWNKLFPTSALQILLPDTFGSPFFFDCAPPELAMSRGVRGDSGDLYQEGERAINFYTKHNENSTEKLYIPSDGLTLKLMFKLSIHFTGRISISHGWGSSLTNHMVDDPKFKPISSVIKPTSVNGVRLVKLSNNIAKAMGIPEDIERYKKIFHYDEKYFKTCIY